APLGVAHRHWMIDRLRRVVDDLETDSGAGGRLCERIAKGFGRDLSRAARRGIKPTRPGDGEPLRVEADVGPQRGARVLAALREARRITNDEIEAPPLRPRGFEVPKHVGCDEGVLLWRVTVEREVLARSIESTGRDVHARDVLRAPERERDGERARVRKQVQALPTLRQRADER